MFTTSIRRARPALQRAAALAWLAAPAPLAAAVPCAGGSIDFTHGSDTPQTGTLYNVGQRVMIAAQPVGITPTAWAWTVDGPAIADYDERVGTIPTGGVAWSTTPLGPAELSGPTLSFYWKPDASQVHPLAGGPVTRTVTLVATVGAVTCPPVSQSFQVERNTTDATKQAVAFYTSNHRAATETNPEKGRVIDDHVEWHTVFGTRLYEFLPWHRELIARFDHWLAEFGYPPVEPWDPGTTIPTGPEIDHSPRLGGYDPNSNRIPTWFTHAGGSGGDWTGEHRLAEYTTLPSMSNSLEGGWHGQVHCNVGPGGWAAMCDFSSPKDPVFWRWHKMIDVVYNNYCGEAAITCAPGPLPLSDAWIGDNAADIAAGGAIPSPGPHWVSPDLWNRTAPATCTPAEPRPGTPRDCGSSADHENPVEGTTNYLYATLRNDRPGAQQVVYLEVGVYVANASSGLAWPADFGGGTAGVPLPESRQFITLNLMPGQTTDIGPLPWTPPSPVPSDHWCAYIRVLGVQTPLGITEGANIDANTGQSNSIAWKNLKIVSPASPLAPEREARFIVRNVEDADARVDLVVQRPPELAGSTRIQLDLGRELTARWRQAGGRADSLRVVEGDSTAEGGVLLEMAGARAVVAGIPMRAREGAGVRLSFAATRPVEKPADVLVTQLEGGRVVGGMQFTLWDRPPPAGGAALPDLVVAVAGPAQAAPGEDISSRVRLTARNVGRAPAPGTRAAGQAGYMVDLVLTRGGAPAVRWAAYAPAFSDGVLLRGGRVSNTVTLAPGESRAYAVGALIPRDTPPGTYCLGAVVDPGTRVGEAREDNNTACTPIRIVAPR